MLEKTRNVGAELLKTKNLKIKKSPDISRKMIPSLTTKHLKLSSRVLKSPQAINARMETVSSRHVQETIESSDETNLRKEQVVHVIKRLRSPNQSYY